MPAVLEACEHLRKSHPLPPKSNGCEECLKTGDSWVHLRECLSCGHVYCCDSSKNKHASAHFRQSAHPVMRSIEPGEGWRWCYVDKVLSEG
ncbi:MAG TPA: UBP-type zinc finger domain-containing protein [Myxococcales bacterium]|jgi:Zn ribbon nucleic-acid-binding protein